MDGTLPQESTLFADLTRIFMTMRSESYAEVEQAIEDRFRRFLRSPAGRDARGLQITLAWTMADGADDLAIQGLRYDTVGAEDLPRHWCR
ncbi:MAG: hypothetical protein ACFCUO_08305 [Rhodospirillales bacterium]